MSVLWFMGVEKISGENFSDLRIKNKYLSTKFLFIGNLVCETIVDFNLSYYSFCRSKGFLLNHKGSHFQVHKSLFG